MSAKDFFINLGALVSLYTVVVSLITLLFTVINTAYPKIQNGYNYFGSTSISWPVATLIIFFPIFILLMWLLEKDYKVNPEKQSSGIHRWLSYLTLFLSGIMLAADLITVLYYFIDGQELTAGFLLKVLVLLVIAAGIFSYYLNDIMGRLTARNRNIYRIAALVIIVGSIVWGFMVLGSPHTQRLYKYDEQKVNDLMMIHSEVMNYYSMRGALPESLADLNQAYYLPKADPQTSKPYEYKKTGALTYDLCAEFNRETLNRNNPSLAHPDYFYGNASWVHPAGYYCVSQTVNPNMFVKPLPIR